MIRREERVSLFVTGRGSVGKLTHTPRINSRMPCAVPKRPLGEIPRGSVGVGPGIQLVANGNGVNERKPGIIAPISVR